jgi:hypothetical protein
MPKLHPDAPDLAVSPDGEWAAELRDGVLRLYDLSAQGGGEGEGGRIEIAAEVERPPHPGRITFLRPDRLLHLWQAPPDGGEGTEGSDGSDGALIIAEMLTVPTLVPSGRSVRAPGCQRILGIGAGGAVVAPPGPGADIIAPRGNELLVHRTFIRNEVISAVSTPDQRFLLEQRSGFELWDPQTRRALARLVLATRQPPAQLGFIHGGRMLWTLTTLSPMHLELFRASDGRRLFEMEQPGRAREAESGTNRLIIAYEEREVLSFLDLDLAARELRKVQLPPADAAPLSFVVVPGSATPAILVRLDEAVAPLLRLPLASLPGREQRPSPARPQAPLPPPAPPERRESRREDRRPERRDERAGASPRPLARLLRNEPPAPQPPPSQPPPSPAPSPIRALRDARPESQFIRRPPTIDPPEELRGPPRRSVRPPAPPQPAPRQVTPVSLPDDDLDLLEGSSEQPLFTLSLPGAASEEEPRPEASAPAPISRAFDARHSPAAWLWELARWTQQSLLGEVGPPPEGGPLQQLGARLRLSLAAQRALALLLGVRALLGQRPEGLSAIEIAEYLGGLHDEPSVLGELLPGAPLRTLGLVRPVAANRGRLVIAGDVAELLLGAPCQGAVPGMRRETLPIGLHLWPRPCPKNPAHLCGQAFVRVDGLAAPEPLLALRRALRRALLHEVAVIVDGLPGLSFPSPHADATLLAARSLLQAPAMPVVLCAPPEAAAALGLLVRQIPESLAVGAADPTAPLLPSAPLPSGITWRSPLLPAPSASPDGGAGGRRGQIEPLASHDKAQASAPANAPGPDRRAGVLVEEGAEPGAASRAAYLAARDGAVLVLSAPWLVAHAGLVAQWLRQLPVLISSSPSTSTGEWPRALAPFVQKER